MKTFLTVAFLIVSLNAFAQSINITYANDSLWMVPCPAGAPPYYDAYTLKANLTGFSLTDTFLVKAEFGDGTYQTHPVYSPIGGLYMEMGQLKIWTSFNHNYLALGTYDITYTILAPNGIADTLFVPADVIITTNCSSFSWSFYVDNNSNCIFDAGIDSSINNIMVTLYNGTAIYANAYNGASFDIPLGVNYTAVVDAGSVQQLGYSLSCPVSGMINFTSSGTNNISFAVNCNSNYDLKVTSSGNPFKIGNSVLVNVGVSAISCNLQSGTYSSNFDPQMNYVLSMNPPVSGSGQVYDWNFANLSTLANGNGSTYNLMYCNLAPGVQIGDTLCYSFSVTPIVGDINPVNNTINRCYEVKSAFDPNFKDVYPPGQGVAGNIAPNTKLTYTIGFQNTGNAPAEDVFLLDTLDSNLDINSIHILFASHPFQLYMIDGNILKFDFPNIQLPDSGSNEMLSHGFVAYEIDMLPGLNDGTQITNNAGIYFDENPPIVTNLTLNTIDYSLGIQEAAGATHTIFPNPASESVFINFEVVIENGEIELFDISGKILLAEKIQNVSNSKISTVGFAPGSYFLKVAADEKISYSKLIIAKQ